MAHLTLQIGTGLVMRFASPRRATRLKLTGLGCVLALLSGCGATIPVPTTVATAGMPNPEEALQTSMRHVDAEMAELGQLTAAAPDRFVVPVVAADLQRMVSFAWTGPLDQGVAKLAASIGYVFFTTGPATAQPLDVAVKLDGVPVFQVFQSLGQEAGDRATVEVDPQHHQVQVIHHV